MKYLTEALKRQSTVWLPIFSCWYSIVFSSLMCVLVGFEWRGVVQAAGISCCEPGRGEGNTTQDGLRSHYSLWWEVCGGLVEQYTWGSSSHVLVTQCSRWGLVSAKPVPHSGSGWPCITSREMCFIDCSWTLLSWLFSFFSFLRFSFSNALNQLPRWVRPYAKIYDKYGLVQRDLTQFFRNAEKKVVPYFWKNGVTAG